MAARIASWLTVCAAALCAGSWSEHGGKCYQAFGQSSGVLNFDAAEAACKSLGGHLATSNSVVENSFLEELCESRLPIGGCWIGLTDKGRPVKNFVWSDGSPYNGAFQAWIDHGGPGNMEPNNDFCTNEDYYTKGGCKYGETADCVLLVSLMHKPAEMHPRNHWNGRWMDTFCGSEHKYICERHAMGRLLLDNKTKEAVVTADGHHVYEIFSNATGSSVMDMTNNGMFHFHPVHGKRKHVDNNETRDWEAEEAAKQIALQRALADQEARVQIEAEKEKNASFANTTSARDTGSAGSKPAGPSAAPKPANHTATRAVPQVASTTNAPPSGASSAPPASVTLAPTVTTTKEAPTAPVETV